MSVNDYIYTAQLSLFGDQEVCGFGCKEFYIKEIDRNLANKTIIKNHYSHKFYNASYIHLGVFISGEFLGVLQYGYAMNPASGDSIVPGSGLKGYLELNRMWLDDKAPRNSESRAISMTIKFIKRKYPLVRWIQSFADERCNCFGIVYQACSFGFYGEHTATFWTLEGQVYHNSLMTRNPKLSKSAKFLQENKEKATSEVLRQFRYIKFFDKKAKAMCKLKEKPYLKYYKGE